MSVNEWAPFSEDEAIEVTVSVSEPERSSAAEGARGCGEEADGAGGGSGLPLDDEKAGYAPELGLDSVLFAGVVGDDDVPVSSAGDAKEGSSGRGAAALGAAAKPAAAPVLGGVGEGEYPDRAAGLNKLDEPTPKGDPNAGG